jgi:RND family efflux transporter MFP subunit
MQSRLFKILLPVVILLAAVGAFQILKMTGPRAQKKKPPISRPLVTVQAISEGEMAVQVRGFGSVQAKRSVAITPQVSGEVVVKNPLFEPGGFFAEGDILLRLDDTDYQLAKAQAEAAVAQAELSLAQAREEAEVARQEWEQMSRAVAGTGTQPTALVLREPQLKLAQANLASARAGLRQAKVNLDRCTITAPFTGRVLDAGADQGQFLRAGMAIGTIYATDVAEITVPVPDEDLAWIVLDNQENGSQPAPPVTITAEFSGSSHTWQGRAVRLGGAVDARSRLVPVVVEVDNPYERVGSRPPLVEGMFVEAIFQGEPQTGTLVIPRTALRPGNVVWVVDEESKLHIVEVAVAYAGIDQAIITEGLQLGQEICISNLQLVTDGMPVRVEGRPEARAGNEPPAGTAEGDKDGER